MPEAFVVSDKKQNAEKVEGVPVKSIDDYQEDANNCFVIIATFPRLQDEIKRLLINKEFNNFYAVDIEKL